ncbi:HdeD family acid-resistance protein [Kriegella aquimaris]|uniref:Uncharacterized membrane protein HdeD, DUF308 family n=1 Tax=Kriegella aquimaris TaxID=192904 RepID=A0A1G9JIK4_9FLAO|nr:DUF308 domain-containing protein [Kriegella aquimaris]SDL37430.1 Uncharacterized membrane protein HdeD, DUF308 family [Kriegella aquimaris]
MNYFSRIHCEPLTKKWWKHLLLGILFLLLGIWIFITPMTSYMSLSLFFTLALIITGVFEIIASMLYRKETTNWGWHLAGGIVDFIIGGILLFNPAMTMTLLPYVLAIWLMYKGVISALISLRLKSYDIKGWVWMLAMGIGTLLFAILIYIYPVLGGLSIVYATAISFLALGMFNLSVAYHLGKLRKRIENSI